MIMNESTLYWCDPEKNTECRKTSCRYVLRKCEGGVCAATFRRAFARLDENGVPMVYDMSHFKAIKEEALKRLKEREEKKVI